MLRKAIRFHSGHIIVILKISYQLINIFRKRYHRVSQSLNIPYFASESTCRINKESLLCTSYKVILLYLTRTRILKDIKPWRESNLGSFGYVLVF